MLERLNASPVSVVAILAAADRARWREAIDRLPRVGPGHPGAIIVGRAEELVPILRHVEAGPMAGRARLAPKVQIRLEVGPPVRDRAQPDEEAVQPAQARVGAVGKRILAWQL